MRETTEMWPWGPPNVEKLKARHDVVRLIELLRHKDEYLRQRAAAALGQVGDERAVRPLADTLTRSDRGLASTAAMALGMIGVRLGDTPERVLLAERLVTALGGCFNDVRGNAVAALARMGAASLEPLLDALQKPLSSIEQGRAQTEALQRIGPPALDRLVVALSDERAVLRARAAEVLGKIGGDQVGEALVRALERPESRGAVAKALASIWGPRAIKPLVAALWNDGTTYFEVGDLVAALAKLGPATVEPLIAALAHPNENVRGRAAEALGELRAENAIGPLSSLLEDASWFVQRYAADALLRLGWQPENDVQRASLAVLTKRWSDVPRFGPLVIPMLVKAFPYALDDRAEIAQILGAMGDERAVEPLLEALVELRNRSRGLPSYTCDFDVLDDAKHVVKALESILARCAMAVAEVTLQVASELGDLTLYCHATRGNEIFYAVPPSRETVNTSGFRKLAREELRRRGVK